MYQVLLSIQTQILVAEPYFNEPGTEGQRHTAVGRAASGRTNAELRLHTLRHACVAVLRDAPAAYPELLDALRAHFRGAPSLLFFLSVLAFTALRVFTRLLLFSWAPCLWVPRREPPPPRDARARLRGARRLEAPQGRERVQGRSGQTHCGGGYNRRGGSRRDQKGAHYRKLARSDERAR